MVKDAKVIEKEKQNAAYRAADHIKSGMILGLGSGSTVRHLIYRIASEKIVCSVVPTSYDSELMANNAGIPIVELPEEGIDLAIDGADEVALKTLALIKGGGGALTREKIVRMAAKKFIVIADSRKYVERLGNFPVAVEVLPFGWKRTRKKLEELGGKASLRMAKAKLGPIISDNGNLILDLKMNNLIESPKELEVAINSITGVIENGIFSNHHDFAYIGEDEAVKMLEKPK
ncbi:MAG: ribose-5-phosphate isomerase RpiA [Candidatus Hodarchaeota archaeon]